VRVGVNGLIIGGDQLKAPIFHTMSGLWVVYA